MKKTLLLFVALLVFASCELSMSANDGLPVSDLDREQARVVVDSDGSLQLLDSSGREIGDPDTLSFLKSVWDKLEKKDGDTFYVELGSTSQPADSSARAVYHQWRVIDEEQTGVHWVYYDGDYYTCVIWKFTYECFVHQDEQRKITRHSVPH